jgi:hypothetical protein
MRMKTLVILVLIVPAVILTGLYVGERFQVDACLDSGGSFNYATMTCDPAVSHPYIPFLVRHRAFSIFAFISGCLALFTAWFVR